MTLKLKNSKRIQAMVDARKGSSLQPACDLFVPAAGAVDGMRGHLAHFSGVKDAFALLVKAEKAMKKMGRTYVPDFGVYVAEQDTSDGKDRLYFVGTIAGIMQRIGRISADAQLLFPPGTWPGRW